MAGDGLEVGDILNSEAPSASAVDDGPTDRVLGARLGRRGQRQELVVIDAGGWAQVGQTHLSFGQGAGLVEHDSVDALGALQNLPALDEHAEAGAASGADHDGGRRGQPEGARAGNDQHRYRRHQALRRIAGQRPPERGRHRDGHDGGDEHAGDSVGEALDGGLAALGFLDQAHDLGQGGVGTDGSGPDGEDALAVDGGAGHPVTGSLVDGDGLAGEHGLVDRRAPLEHLAVDGDLLTGPDPHDVADADLLDRDHPLVAVAVAVDDEPGLLGAELE